MTNGELIELLKQYPADLQVCAYNGEHRIFCNQISVSKQMNSFGFDYVEIGCEEEYEPH